MQVWQFIQNKLNNNCNVQLLYVLQSEGSSPGRQNFKMAVAADGEFFGTIGGGIMEHKLVEKAKSLLSNGEEQVLLQHQYHDKEHTKNQSGMICSGSQQVAFIPLTKKDIFVITEIILSIQHRHSKALKISPSGISAEFFQIPDFYLYKDDNEWEYFTPLNHCPVAHVFGGGHVSLALSQILHFLGFYIKVYDDRPELNTLQQNHFADEKIIVESYDRIDEYIDDTYYDFFIIMTIGYRTDKIVLKRLFHKLKKSLNKNISYIGLLGSENKIETLFNELKKEDIDSETLKNIFSPIGINIFSKTAQEIAISIAAEIIREKNKNLSTGRSTP